MPVGKSAEWLVLTLVILATLSIGFEPETETVEEFDVTHMSGTITLATRASMDALGLDDYDRDAKANLDIQVQSVVSDQCENCTGVLMQGPVNVTELKGGGTGRVQANIEVVHIRENIGDHMIAREWLSFEWDVIGGDDFTCVKRCKPRYYCNPNRACNAIHGSASYSSNDNAPRRGDISWPSKGSASR